MTAHSAHPLNPTSTERVDIERGLLRAAQYNASPNADARPDSMLPELIVVHGISLPPGEFGGPWIEALFMNRLPPEVHPYFEAVAPLQVSSHLLIRRAGEIVQFVPFSMRAWHAGKSNFRGRERCNDFSIGIELEGADDVPYEPAQYRALTQAILALCEAYPSLSLDRVTGHSDISPGRKSDPGPSFDWPRLRAMLAAGSAR
jgi:AmpD protein